MVLIASLFVGRIERRRRIATLFARAFFRAVGVRLTVTGLDRLPAQPCVVVANHASNIDGIVAVAALPPSFAFVIKKEMSKVPLVSLLLRRLGSEFVERFDRHKGATDTRRVLRTAAGGQSLMFFPEGTFNAERCIGRFKGGAFATAARSRMPVVAVAIHGTREVLPVGSARMRRTPIHVEVLAVITTSDARQASRELIANALGEPLAP